MGEEGDAERGEEGGWSKCGWMVERDEGGKEGGRGGGREAGKWSGDAQELVNVNILRATKCLISVCCRVF